MVRQFMALAFTLGLATQVAAHEGHGRPGEGHTILHYLVDPLHLPLLMVVAVAGVASAYCIFRYMKRNTTRGW